MTYLQLTKQQRDTLLAQLTGDAEMKRAYLASERSYVRLTDKEQVTQQLATLEKIMAQLVYAPLVQDDHAHIRPDA